MSQNLLSLHIFISRYCVHLPNNYITATISTVPPTWYHLVFNYIGTTNAEGVVIYHDGVHVGSSTEKTSYARNTRPGVVVIGRYFVQLLEEGFASVVVDELLFFNRIITTDEVQILYNMHK